MFSALCPVTCQGTQDDQDEHLQVAHDPVGEETQGSGRAAGRGSVGRAPWPCNRQTILLEIEI